MNNLYQQTVKKKAKNKNLAGDHQTIYWPLNLVHVPSSLAPGHHITGHFD